jgi:hypothetical protein
VQCECSGCRRAHAALQVDAREIEAFRGMFDPVVSVCDAASHTSHVTRHTSHVTRHTSHVTRHRLLHTVSTPSP